MQNKIQLINPKKATTSNSIPPKILKISSEVSADVFQSFFIDVLKTGNFHENMKPANITPIFKKNNPLHKVNYRPVSAFEKLMQKQISDYISNYLSPYLCGYRKGFSS